MRSVTAPLDYDASRYAEAPVIATERTLTRVRQTLRTWRERSKTRRALAGLSPRLLEDVGLEDFEAMEEAAKPFWRA